MIMKKVAGLIVLCLGVCSGNCLSQKSILRLEQATLMNEVRATPSPLDGEHVRMNPPRFMWPDKYPHLGPVLDGVPGHVEEKPEVLYRIRISRDKTFKDGVIVGEQPWAFFNPFQCLEPGQWYWQYAYVTPQGVEEWSSVLTFYVDKDVLQFNPPAFEQVMEHLPQVHPRILLDAGRWEHVIQKNQGNPEAMSYIARADHCLANPLKHLEEEIDTSTVVSLSNIVQRESALIRESRKIVDREEENVEALVRAYLLTKENRYYKEGINRLLEILSWRQSKYFAGDFNLGTLLSMSTSAYDGYYNLLTLQEKQTLLENIKFLGSKFYHEYVNHLENRIADNHVWQMTFRILTMAAFATVGDIPESSVWARYCYNEWVSRFPGLNDDGAWHNGDAYFHVNIRTLIEVPAFYSRISGFDFFADPWYNNNALYVIYEQPPFSKSGGQGNSHEKQLEPTGGRVGYADALARECQNPWATAYVDEILQKDPEIFSRPFEKKPADLAWYRCTTDKERPPYVHHLSELPSCKVFSESGLALMNTDLGHYESNAMLSFRSSPYGSTSHALANQNSFNTFYGGKAIFYSTGHRTGFTDDHCMYAYRNTRAHNSILVNGMGQRIGTEGYGWIPRYYEGTELSYVVGDASNAYGEVISPLWLERGRLSGTNYTPENGWDKNKLDFFRRHIVQLGDTGLFVVFDELDAKENVEWNYLLHTVEQPMEINESSGGLRIVGRNNSGGVSVSHLFASARLTYCQTDSFFVPPVDWKKSEKKALEKHFHFTATAPASRRVCFLNILDVHGNDRADLDVVRKGNVFTVGDWVVEWSVDGKGIPGLKITNERKGVSLQYNRSKAQGTTRIVDCVEGKRVKKVLSDVFPHLEI